MKNVLSAITLSLSVMLGSADFIPPPSPVLPIDIVFLVTGAPPSSNTAVFFDLGGSSDLGWLTDVRDFTTGGPCRGSVCEATFHCNAFPSNYIEDMAQQNYDFTLRLADTEEEIGYGQTYHVIEPESNGGSRQLTESCFGFQALVQMDDGSNLQQLFGEHTYRMYFGDTLSGNISMGQVDGPQESNECHQGDNCWFYACTCNLFSSREELESHEREPFSVHLTGGGKIATGLLFFTTNECVPH